MPQQSLENDDQHSNDQQDGNSNYLKLEPVDLSKERNKWEKLADLYAIIVTVEHLEIVWARGCCTDDEYTKACKQLITRFKAQQPTV